MQHQRKNLFLFSSFVFCIYSNRSSVRMKQYAAFALSLAQLILFISSNFFLDYFGSLTLFMYELLFVVLYLLFECRFLRSVSVTAMVTAAVTVNIF